MKIKIVNEVANFFNAEQKAVKQKIMEDCIAGVFNNLQDNANLFTELQDTMDLLFSILVMFNRELLVHILSFTNTQHRHRALTRELFSVIDNQVMLKLKELKNESTKSH